MSKKAKALIIVVAALFLAFASAAAYFLAFYRVVRVPTGSMANTIIPGDSVLCAMGDSRDNSQDSRYLGTLPRELIVGKAMMIIGSKTKGNEERLFKPLR